jgi:hypothetical protein
MIYSKRNSIGRRAQDDPYLGTVLRQSPEFNSEVLRDSSSNSDQPRNKIRKRNQQKKKKKTPRQYNGPKSKRNKPSSFAETQINPAFGLPAMAFTSPAIRRPPVGAGSIVPRNTNQALSSLDFARDIANRVGGTVAAANSAIESVKAFDKATGISKRVKNRKKKGNNDGSDDNGNGGGGSSNLNSSSSGGYSYDMMCNKPISEKIEISTGIRSGLIVNPGERNNNDDFSSLYIMCGNMFKEDAIDTSFKHHVEKNIYPDVNREIQYNLNFDYELQLDEFNSWFYDLTKALEVYYALDSVDVYGKKEENNNPGSRYLHTKITSSIRLKLNELRRVLNYQAIPPRLLTAVRYMYQYYKFSELPGAPLYRLCPGLIFHDQADTGGNAYKHKLSPEMLDELITKLTRHTQVHNKIFKAMPSWHVDGYCMPPSCDTAYYDPNFRTFWFNSCLTYTTPDGTVQYTRSGVDSENFRYWLYSNRFDGFFYAMGSFHKNLDSSSGEIGTRPGLWTPVNDFSALGDPNQHVNALCYNVDNNVTAIAQLEATYGRALQFDNLNTPFKHTIGNLTTISVVNNQDGSTQVAQECTFNTYRQAVWEVTEWLFKTS